MPPKITIRREDIERVIAQRVVRNSHARSYFGRVVMKNTTHISSTELMREYGNVPVIVRGDKGIVPKHGISVSDVTPMPIEIDDKISAVDMDEYERATDEGKQQIIDEYLSQHADMLSETINALCVQAIQGEIDYMMKAGDHLERYNVRYGTVKRMTHAKTLAAVTYGEAVKFLSDIRSLVTKQGVGGTGKFIASNAVYARFADILASSKMSENIKDGYLIIGAFRVEEDNDSYIDVDASGNKVTKTLCGVNDICYMADNAGQKLCYLRLDDVIQRSAVAIYSFTKDDEDQRGTKLYTKSKPFPLPNPKGIAFGSFKEQTYKVTFTAGNNGSLTASVNGTSISSGDDVVAGSTVTFTATPSSGYEVDSWGGTDAGELTDLGNGKKSVDVGKAITVSVSFKTSA